MTSGISRSGMRAEMQLLIGCARARLDAGQAEQLRPLLRRELDWDYLLRMARKHRLRPLLYQHLNEICPEAVPEPVLRQLREYFQRNCRRNLLFTGELLKLLRLFDAQGIRAVPYKGPALTLALYGNLALREFTDLDILVPAQKVRRATELLQTEGYQRQFQLGSAQEAAFLYHHNQHRFRHRENGLAVEIHWRFEPRHFSFPLDPESLRPRLQALPVSGQPVWVYAPEDLFLLLCVHGLQHLWEQLRWVSDLAEMVRVHEDLDWSRIAAQARALGAERTLWLGARLSHDLLGAAFPDAIMTRIKAEPLIQRLAEQVQQQLPREADRQPGFLATALFHLRAREHWPDRWRYGFRLAVTPTGLDWSLLPLPPLLSPLYYAIRPLRLAVKYGLGLKSMRDKRG